MNNSYLLHSQEFFVVIFLHTHMYEDTCMQCMPSSQLHRYVRARTHTHTHTNTVSLTFCTRSGEDIRHYHCKALPNTSYRQLTYVFNTMQAFKITYWWLPMASKRFLPLLRGASRTACQAVVNTGRLNRPATQRSLCSTRSSSAS